MARRRAASARRNAPSGGATRSTPKGTARRRRMPVCTLLLATTTPPSWTCCWPMVRQSTNRRPGVLRRCSPPASKVTRRSRESSSTPAQTRTWLGMTAPPCSIPAARATSRSLLARVRITLKKHTRLNVAHKPRRRQPLTPERVSIRVPQAIARACDDWRGAVGGLDRRESASAAARGA